MKKNLIAIIIAAFRLNIFAAAEMFVDINPAVEKGMIKMMNCINNGPTKQRSDQTRGNFDEFKDAKIPFARVHNANLNYSYGAPHVIDISSVFPKWDADETKEENYDFVITDEYLENMIKAGTQPYFRLGESSEKYKIYPPKDFAKWARICEYIVRHCNEGWANGHKWNIKYWEIWNEPDNELKTKDGQVSKTWLGTKEEFLNLYKETSLHLRKCFGNKIKIGGPSFAKHNAWEKDFVPFCAKEKLPLDFYSWHWFSADAREAAKEATEVRKILDANGFKNTELHVTEFNYRKGTDVELWRHTLNAIAGNNTQKGAACIAATMLACQDSPIDMLMLETTSANALFHRISYFPMKGYYPFVAWDRLYKLGVQIEAKVEKTYGSDQLHACAAKSEKGKMGLMIARYHDSNDLTEVRKVTIKAPTNMGIDWSKARCFLTDSTRTYTETPLMINGNGTVSLKMQPNSFAFIEFAGLRALMPSTHQAPWARGWWLPRHNQKMAEVKAGGAPVVFIGDSITHFWESNGKAQWEKYFASGKYRAMNLGFSGDRTEHVLWRIQNGELDGYEAKAIVLMIGTNNTGHFIMEEETPQNTRDGIKAVIAAIQAKQPKAKIIFCAIFPRDEKPNGHNRIRNSMVNDEFARFADGDKVIWCDFTSKFLAKDGTIPRSMMGDFLHPGPQGYDIWVDAILPHLDKILEAK